jgi:predicted phosphodiesterase
MTEWLQRTQYDTSKFGYVFAGHTHVQDLWSIGCTNCYNMGSWVVETGCPVPDCMVAVIDTEKEKAVVDWVNCSD